MACCNRGGSICAVLLLCATAAFAQTNLTSRSRDNGLVNLAVQAVQQVQAQEQTNLRAVSEARQEIASLRRITLLVGVGLGAGLLALAVYLRALLRASRPRRLPLLPHAGADTLLRRAAAFEDAHRLEEALACYEQVLALDKSLTEAYVGKGRVLNQLERYREALACFEQAGQVNR